MCSELGYSFWTYTITPLSMLSAYGFLQRHLRLLFSVYLCASVRLVFVTLLNCHFKDKCRHQLILSTRVVCVSVCTLYLFMSVSDCISIFVSHFCLSLAVNLSLFFLHLSLSLSDHVCVWLYLHLCLVFLSGSCPLCLSISPYFFNISKSVSLFVCLCVRLCLSLLTSL